MPAEFTSPSDPVDPHGSGPPSRLSFDGVAEVGSGTVQRGASRPLGATWDGRGTNFAVFSERAYMIELCLFDDGGGEHRVELWANDGGTHHGYLPGVGPGQRYGFRAHGPWDPSRGLRFNPAKLLTDPYAHAIEGVVNHDGAVVGHDQVDPDRPDGADSAPAVPRSVVVDRSYDWADDRPPATPWSATVIYETHVKGLTMTHPDVPPELRGTYAAMATEPVIAHLVGLGVTAVELLPVHQFAAEPFLARRGLTNYWGYATLGFLAPHGAYAASGQRGQQVVEFKDLVRALHRAGIEVILDVVYNHTAEGPAEGPTLSLRGLDNTTYYRLDDRGDYVDVTGTGNSLNVDHPASLMLVMDSLRYWVEEMRVDGFRFDLAPALTRDRGAVDPGAAFLDLVHQDPVIGGVKLIAEPWDVGPDGYQLGGFPPLWSEWNDRFRDDVRDFWRGADGSLSTLASRLAGSSDVFDVGRRQPRSSINFVTAHDGFTLADLVAYDHKHNLANTERNRDGHGDNRSWNGGVEGPTDDPEVADNRRRRSRSLLATLLLAQGVPMLAGGDEMGRTQLGNNNAYCQDNELSWYDWAAADAEMIDWVTELVQFRHRHPVFRRTRFLTGMAGDGGPADVEWYRPDGAAMASTDWDDPHARAVAVFLNGEGLPPDGSQLEPGSDESFLLLVNGGPEPTEFAPPESHASARWRIVLDSGGDAEVRGGAPGEPADGVVAVGAWAVVVLERQAAPSEGELS